jgi:hypothetical protein
MTEALKMKSRKKEALSRSHAVETTDGRKCTQMERDMQLVGVGFHADALSPVWKPATTFRFALPQGGIRPSIA